MDRDEAISDDDPEDSLLDAAWGVIANAGWDGQEKTEGWQEAAVRWRDRYHQWLKTRHQNEEG